MMSFSPQDKTRQQHSSHSTIDYLTEMGLEYEWQHEWLQLGHQDPLMPNVFAMLPGDIYDEEDVEARRFSSPVHPCEIQPHSAYDAGMHSHVASGSSQTFPYIVIPNFAEDSVISKSIVGSSSHGNSCCSRAIKPSSTLKFQENNPKMNSLEQARAQSEIIRDEASTTISNCCPSFRGFTEPKTIQAACDILGQLLNINSTGLSKLDVLIKVIDIISRLNDISAAAAAT